MRISLLSVSLAAALLVPLFAIRVGAAVGTAPQAPVNLDFKVGVPGEIPEGWAVLGQHPRAYKVEVRSDPSRVAHRCVVISGGSAEFVTASQWFDARPWRGQRVEFTGALRYRSEAGKGHGALWLRADGDDGRVLAFDNMDDRPITSWSWTPARIFLEIPLNADKIYIGTMLVGTGELWTEEVKFRALGKRGEGDVPPRPLTDHGLDNLVAFTRLLGYMRHFDPADPVVSLDWNAFAIAAIDTVEGARDAAELAATLGGLFQPLDPVLRVDTRPIESDSLAVHGPDDSVIGVVRWQHHGWGAGTVPAGPYWSRQIREPLNRVEFAPGPLHAITASLGSGVYCGVPTALWADSSGSLPHTRDALWKPSGPRPAGFLPSASDRSTRLAGVVLCWGVLQHFFPYFDVVKTDWEAALRQGLRSAATDRGPGDYLATLERLTAHLDDGHAGVLGPGQDDPFNAPFAWRWLGRRLVVTTVSDSCPDSIRPGDVVGSVNGIPTEDRYRAVAARISASTAGRKRHLSLSRMAPTCDTLALDVEGADGVRRRVSVASRTTLTPDAMSHPRAVDQLRPGIWYVDATHLNDSTFASVVDTLARARGVIFDVRGYPGRLGTEPLAHLTNRPMTSARWGFPIVRKPDHRDPAFEWSSWKVKPMVPRFRGRVAFLIDAKAISYAETWLGIVERYRLGALIGEPTAGTNGNVNQIHLPGGYTVSFTGMRVLKHDGSPHHGIGIRPTVPVSPTLARIREGRDEQLEKAIEFVSR